MIEWTFQLELVPDSTIPQFKRLRYHRVEIALADIFQRGIHPNSALLDDHERVQTGAPEVILGKLNAEPAYVAALKAHNIGSELSVAPGYFYGQSHDEIEWMLRHVAQWVYFVDDLSYEQLVEIAIAQLRKHWTHKTAKEMTHAVGRDFNGIREFLKRKDPTLVVVSYQSLDEHDLSRVVSVDDFLTEDALLIRHGIELQNFRRADSLAAFTDPQGRLRLFSAIKHCSVEWRREQDNSTALLTYHCAVAGDRVQWQPDLTSNLAARAAAKRVARKFGRGTGTYCFTSSIQDMELVARESRFRLRFPGLSYKDGHAVTDATAQLKTDSVVCYGETSRLWATNSNDQLKHVLRSFGKPVTGRKEELVKRVVELLVEQCEATEKEMDAFFSRHRFVRVGQKPKEKQPFAVLQGRQLRETLVTLYCLRHMRGNVVLEASHVNQSVKLADLAEAFLNGQVDVSGCFVPVV